MFPDVHTSTIINVELDLHDVTLTINPTPSDATVRLTADGYTQVGNSITVIYGTIVHCEVSKPDYITYTEDIEMVDTMTKSVTIEPDGYIYDLDGFAYTKNYETKVITISRYFGEDENIVIPRGHK